MECSHFAWKIECDGRELSITPNCEAALRRLRRGKQSRILWIDQICIDQETVDEKNYQVALMGDLYSIAEKVIVRLGINSAADKFLEYVNLYPLSGFWKKVPMPVVFHCNATWNTSWRISCRVSCRAGSYI